MMNTIHGTNQSTCLYCGAPLLGSVCTCCGREADWNRMPVCFSLSDDKPFLMTELPSNIPYGSSIEVKSDQNAAIYHAEGIILIPIGTHSVFYHPRIKGLLCLDDEDYLLSEPALIMRQEGASRFNETQEEKPRYYKIWRVKPLDQLYQAFKKYHTSPPIKDCFDNESVIYLCKNCEQYVHRNGKWCPVCKGRIYV